jgi:shikimate dehydrogenase
VSNNATEADNYAVIGNPVSHSLSPQIHTLFAAQTNQSFQYQAIEINEENFEQDLFDLQQQQFKGVNITVPFKRKAWELSDTLSPRAKDAGAVNTLIFQEDGNIAGDNTDGVGLTRDMTQNLRILIRQRKILILGAGGAVRGVLGPILAHGPRNLTIANRSLDKAETLAEDFSALGKINVSAYEDLGRENFDLIINATAAGLSDDVPLIPDEVLGTNSVCYDMMYKLDKATAFVDWALSRGAVDAHDGLGMLVEQAAESFYIWRGVRVETTEVFESLRPT